MRFSRAVKGPGAAARRLLATGSQQVVQTTANLANFWQGSRGRDEAA
jgi:hypothetical protein